MSYVTPQEYSRQVQETLRRSRPKTREERHAAWLRLIQLGWINSNGEVTHLLGGDAAPEVPLNEDGTPVNPPQDAASAGGHSA